METNRWLELYVCASVSFPFVVFNIQQLSNLYFDIALCDIYITI